MSRGNDQTVHTRNPHSQLVLSTQPAIREIPIKIRINNFKEIGMGEDSRQWLLSEKAGEIANC